MTRSTPRLATPGHPAWWLVIAGVSWGTSGTLGTLLRRDSGLSLVAIAGYRIAVGGLLLMALAAATGRAVLPTGRAGWRHAVAIGALSALYQACFFSALGHVGVAIATLVTIGSAPAMVMVVETLTGRHRFTLRSGLTLALALGGLALLAGVGSAGRATGNVTLGCLFALGAGASFAGITLVGTASGPSIVGPLGVSLFGGGVVVFGLAGLDIAPAHVSLPIVALILLLGLVPTAVAYGSYFRGLRGSTATLGVVVTLLEPITATVLAAVVLGERLSPAGVLGALMLCAAIVTTATEHLGRDTTPAQAAG